MKFNRKIKWIHTLSRLYKSLLNIKYIVTTMKLWRYWEDSIMILQSNVPFLISAQTNVSLIIYILTKTNAFHF